MRISDWSSDVCSSDLLQGGSMIEYLGANISTSGPGRSNDHGYPVTEPDGAAAGLFFINTLFQFLLGPAEFTASVNHAFRAAPRSEERRVGKECVSTCRYRGSRGL